MDTTQIDYTLWIEAEEWVSGTWTPDDSNTDVILTRSDGSRWIASFMSYRNVFTLVEKNKRTGENLGGVYLVSDEVLIDVVSRPRIEQVIQELIRDGSFESVFRCCPPEDDEEQAAKTN